MNLDYDFSSTPRQRQRAREIAFYRVLAIGAALAASGALALGWSIDAECARLRADTQLLQHALLQLQPRLTEVARLEGRIVAQRDQLAAHVEQATQRNFAPRTLQALAGISPVHIRLHQVVLRAQGAEIRGAASDQRQLQELVKSLDGSGLGRVRLQEMKQQIATPTGPPLRYGFTLLLQAGPANVANAANAASADRVGSPTAT